MSARSIGGKGFLQHWKLFYCQNSSLSWRSAAPQSPRRDSARPDPSSPPPLPWSAGPHGRLRQRRIATLQAATLKLRAVRGDSVPAVAALAGRNRSLSHPPRVDFTLSGQLRDAEGLPGMRDPWRRDPKPWPRRLLRKVAEQEPLPGHVERQGLGSTLLARGSRRLGWSPPGAGGRAPVAVGAESLSTNFDVPVVLLSRSVPIPGAPYIRHAYRTD